MVSKSLAPSFNFKFISKIKFLNFLCSLFILLFLLQVILKYKDYDSDFTTLSEVEKEYRKTFNLMVGSAEVGQECTLDYINENKLAQDHPCVIKLIRNMYLNPPSHRDVPYNLTDITPFNLANMTPVQISPGYHPGKRTGSEMEAFLLKNKKKGFFVECGAFDGVYLANTLDLELDHSWTGLLIEANPSSYERLLGRNRKAWSSNVCLSLMPYPTKIGFTSYDTPFVASQVLTRIVETDDEEKSIINDKSEQPFGITNRKAIKIQCFPLYSLLLSVKQTTVDYFSLDIEGHEKRVLETIPWEKVDIKMMRIETMHIPREPNNKTGSEALKEFLEGDLGYVKFNIDNADDTYIKK